MSKEYGLARSHDSIGAGRDECALLDKSVRQFAF